MNTCSQRFPMSAFTDGGGCTAMTDVQLLERHRAGDEAVFADLVRRHVGWVYGVAKRRLGDPHLAEDVAQAVFVLLHRKAPRFEQDRAMVSWLHRAAWYATQVAIREQRRRRKRETEAAMMRPATANDAEPQWAQLAPVLDELVEKLSKADREAILLRYYRDLSHADVGREMGVTAEAARKRVERALDKLRELAAGRGMTLSSAAIGLMLAEKLSVAAPAGLVATATGAATASAGSALAGASGGAIVKGAVFLMAAKQTGVIAAGVAALLLIGGTALFVVPPAGTAGVKKEQVARPVDPGGGGADRGARAYPKLAPYSAIRWRGERPEVFVAGVWYEFVSLDGRTAAEIAAGAKRMDPKDWRRRFGEDLVEVLHGMGHAAGPTAKLQLRRLDTGEMLAMDDAPMTHENRQRVRLARDEQERSTGIAHAVGGGAAAPRAPAPMPAKFAEVAPFSGVRWRGETSEVEVSGTWYELVSLDDRPAAGIVAAARAMAPDAWQKRFGEDLVEVLGRMGTCRGTPSSSS